MRIGVALLILWPTLVKGQAWNREAYPDYNPNLTNPDLTLVKFVSQTMRNTAGKPMTRRQARAMAASAGLPDHVNNAETKYFPPVFNQDGGSCGSASRICYMFTHEINSYRDLNSSTAENNYPSHFVWLLTYGGSSKDDFVTNVGVPTSATYGGRTYSRIYGNYDWDSDCFGWMQGYDRWLSAFSNRMTTPTQVPYNLGTEEGRLAAKAWLYNHAGDTSFKSGGLIGLGVASGGNWQKIPQTKQNDALGVTGKYYVKAWGTSVDHALTMVGYDDRIEFDLDENGVFGEEDKDEVGAWIIVNSWGTGWCNGGFIYCPYAMGGPAVNSEGKLTGFWTGELYHTRKDYRPLRTIKLKMDYSRRSELLLQAGVSSDLNATEPERIISMDHFKYAGDGHNGDTNPAPETPMLGKWADGKMHTEPMEFGYDLTDLSSDYDRNQSLKYFFIVNTRSWGLGEGHIYEASIMDYEYDLEGVEVPFDLGETGEVEVKSAGEKTIISVIVYGASYNAPQNVAVSNGQLRWDAPIPSGHTLEGYTIYQGDQKLLTLNASTRSYDLKESGSYGVVAVYEGGVESSRATANSPIAKQSPNLVTNFKKGGFIIPGIFNSSYEECTIEYYIKPNSLINYNNMFGPGWGTFYGHCNSDGTLSVGWNTGGHRIDATSAKLSVNTWSHVAIVVKGNKLTAYINGTAAGSVGSGTYSGIGGFGNLVFSNAGNNYQDASYDEIRIWNCARTASEVKSTYNREFYGEVQPDGLIAYYKGDVIEIDGQSYLRDCIGAHHAMITNANFNEETPSSNPSLLRPRDRTNILSINEPVKVNANVPVKLTTNRGDAIRTLVWNIPDLGITDWYITSPTVTFPKAGTYKVQVTGYDYEADASGDDAQAREITAELDLTVGDAPALDADFTISATEVGSGEHVSFKVSNFVQGYVYEWSMPGADVEKVNTPIAGATFQKPGDYEVTLTVTSPSGEKKQKTQVVSVSAIMPEADFAISEAIIMKGETTKLTSTSKHYPTNLTWTLNGTIQKTTVKGYETYEFTPEEPGVYDVTLEASNAKGSHSKTQERALVVTNADSKNGLTFGSAATLTLSKPISDDAEIKKLTIDWWMFPETLAAPMTMGEGYSSFLIYSDASGCLHFLNGSRDVKSSAGCVVAGQWHHYAVTYNAGTVTFYRDGKQISSASGAGGSISRPETFAIALSGRIDEFRIWNATLTLSILQSLCNQPIEDPEYYITGDKKKYYLRLYYQFNQSSGDVTDATSYGNTGIRSGFGPEGDSWGLSKGVFCLNFGRKQDDVVIDGINGIEEQVTPSTSARRGIYDMSGRRIQGSDASLRPGLYIIDGRKVVIR